MNVMTLAQEIINGRRLCRGEDLSFFETADLKDLCRGADLIREKLCGSHVDLCSIINARSGRCGEEAFKSGANATITGNMLTTCGTTIKGDRQLLTKLGRTL